jgi:hypothetical protein
MSADALDHLTAAEKTVLRISLPTDDEVMIGWATPLLDLTPAQKALAVADQMAVLEGLWDDPRAWCVRALEMAGRRP